MMYFIMYTNIKQI